MRTKTLFISLALCVSLSTFAWFVTTFYVSGSPSSVPSSSSSLQNFQPSNITVTTQSIAFVNSAIKIQVTGLTPSSSVSVTIGGKPTPFTTSDIASSSGTLTSSVVVPILHTGHYQLVVRDNSNSLTGFTEILVTF